MPFCESCIATDGARAQGEAAREGVFRSPDEPTLAFDEVGTPERGLGPTPSSAQPAEQSGAAAGTQRVRPKPAVAWTRKSELALMQFLSRDATLREWALTGGQVRSGSVLVSLDIFNKKARSPDATPESTRDKVVRCRDKYKKLRRVLSEKARGSSTTTWNAEDLEVLAKAEAEEQSNWIAVFHNTIALKVYKHSSKFGAARKSAVVKSSRPPAASSMPAAVAKRWQDKLASSAKSVAKATSATPRKKEPARKKEARTSSPTAAAPDAPSTAPSEYSATLDAMAVQLEEQSERMYDLELKLYTTSQMLARRVELAESQDESLQQSAQREKQQDEVLERIKKHVNTLGRRLADQRS